METRGLAIVVLLRQVRDARPPARLISEGAAIRDVGARCVVNPADLAALQISVDLARERGASVTAVAVGQPSLEDALRLALAMGAGRAIRIWDPALEEGDAVADSRVFRRALEILRPALVFTGARLLDRGDDPAPALAAASHGIPCAGAALSLHLERDRAVVVRKAAKGARERLSLALPCAVLFDAAAAVPSYPDLPAVLRSLEAAIERWGLEHLGLPARELGLDGALLRPAGFSQSPRNQPLRVPTPDPAQPAHERVRALFSGGVRQREGRTHFVDAEETARQVARILAEEAFLR